MPTDNSKAHGSFDFLRQHTIPSLNITVQEFEHRKTGAQHIHLSANSEENACLLAFRTVPKDSTGVAHVLEHTVLCGSKKYPIRDLFFKMSQRSISTYMNAITSSDWTAYPFASLNDKDFNNLLNIYLDVVFFPLIDPLDFSQEGHRLEFCDPENPESDLLYKGVVYNEMKGKMSSISSQLHRTTTTYLWPNSTYHHSSGGDPDCITDLTHEQVQSFHQTHYHPSNCIFLSYGNMHAADLQKKFEQNALNRFEKSLHKIEVSDEKRYYAPIEVKHRYPYNGDNIETSSYVTLNWLLGETTDLLESLRAALMSQILLGNSASPLRLALETSTLGNALAPTCGLESNKKFMSFSCGLAGCRDTYAEEIEKLILTTLKKICEDGIPKETIESILHQVEIAQRQQLKGSTPYGLQLIFSALTAATHRADIIARLDLNTALEKLREEINHKDFIGKQINKLLIGNPHRVRIVLSPCDELGPQKEQAEKAKLQAIKDALTPEQKKAIIEDSKALKKRQSESSDTSILPKVTKNDLPKKVAISSKRHTDIGIIPATLYQADTNGLIYQQVYYDMPKIDQEAGDHMLLYAQMLPELGIGKQSYLDVQRRHERTCSAFSAFLTTRASAENIQTSRSFFAITTSALSRNHKALNALMYDTLTEINFNNPERIREIIQQSRCAYEQEITNNGSHFATFAASSGASPAAYRAEQLGGLAGIKKLIQLDNALAGKDDIAAFIAQLSNIHQTVLQNQAQLLLIGNEDELNQACHHIKTQPIPCSSQNQSTLDLPQHDQIVKQAWLTNSQVNFCAKAYTTVPQAHEDTPALTVLGSFLSNNFLHQQVREKGGAYDVGAAQSGDIGSFRFYTYRDPRLSDTLDDFDRSIEWLLSTSHSTEKIDNTILAVANALDIDRSMSPPQRAEMHFFSDLHGRGSVLRQKQRDAIMSITESDLKRVAEKYLRKERESIAVITDFSRRQQVENLKLEICHMQ